MDTENTSEVFKSTMTLREPKRKRRVRLRPSNPLPFNIGPDGELIVYTGHLSSLGVCVVDSEGIQALHSNVRIKITVIVLNVDNNSLLISL